MRKEKEVQEALSARYRSSKATGPVHDRRTTSSLQPITSNVVDVSLPSKGASPRSPYFTSRDLRDSHYWPRLTERA